MAKWTRLEDGKARTKDPWLKAACAEDIPGVYVDDGVTRFKAYATVIERDARGREHKRQVTRTFSIRDPESAWEALEEARAWKRQTDTATALHRAAPKSTTVEDLFRTYLETQSLKPSTRAGYRSMYENWIAPRLGSYALRNVDHAAVENWWKTLEAPPAAREKAGRLVRSLLKFAYRRGMLAVDAGAVLTISTPRPRAIRPEDIPTHEQVAQLADEIGPRYRALVLLLAYGGVRFGEAAGLRVDRVDFDRGRVTIDRAVSEVRGRLIEGDPKTYASTRVFVAPATVIDALREHVERFPTDTGYVFSTSLGTILRHSGFDKNVWRPACDRAGLTGLHIHDLRHTCASMLAAAGFGAFDIAKRLGHSNPAITQQTYMHLLETRDQAMAEAQDRALTPTG
jgi:integrase